MKHLFDRIVKNPKSSMVAVVVIGASFMMYQGKISATDWSLIVGAIGGLYGLLKKDNDI